MECFFVFVEGPDDERFITSVLGNDKIKVIKYAREKKEYINRYIKSIKSIPNYDYIVICDIDLKSLVEKKNAILAQFPDCEVEKIIVSIAEIESWYIAGVDEITSKAMKIKYVYYTDYITKEKFNQMIPSKIDRTQIVNTKATIFKNYFSRLYSPYLVHITLKLTFSQHANKACTMQT